MNNGSWHRAWAAWSRVSQAGVSVIAATACLAPPAAAQPELRVPPLFGGALLVGGDISVTMGSRDGGFYNHTDYDVSLLRYATVQVDAEWRLGDRASLVAEVRSENDHGVEASAWLIRVRPFAGAPLVVEAGRIPHVVGQATNRRYGNENPLIGLPLAYQYLTSLRTDAVPASADALLRSRGRGWLLRYPSGVGSGAEAAGVPLIAALRWDSGVKVAWNPGGVVEAAVAVTMGSLSRPRVEDDNGGRQIAARVVARPGPAVAVGVSAARGAYLADVARLAVADATATGAREWYQDAWGADIEWSRGHWLARAEVLHARWDMARVARPVLPPRLAATAGMLEGRYRVHPRAWVAARAEHLAFSKITGAAFDGRPTAWDAPVTRVESGLGLLVTRQVVVKASYQHARRDAGRVRRAHLGAVQLSFWF